MQRTLVLLKPDCVQRRLAGEVIGRFEARGLKIVGMKFMKADRPLAEKHYAEHASKPFYGSLLDFLTSAPTVAMVLEGPEAVPAVRMMMGKTNGAESPPGTIRGDYALSIQNNLIHGSDSPESAAKEIALWFKGEELVEWEACDKAWQG